jgi:hypothetical protein
LSIPTWEPGRLATLGVAFNNVATTIPEIAALDWYDLSLKYAAILKAGRPGITFVL